MSEHIEIDRKDLILVRAGLELLVQFLSSKDTPLKESFVGKLIAHGKRLIKSIDDCLSEF